MWHRSNLMAIARRVVTCSVAVLSQGLDFAYLDRIFRASVGTSTGEVHSATCSACQAVQPSPLCMHTLQRKTSNSTAHTHRCLACSASAAEGATPVNDVLEQKVGPCDDWAGVPWGVDLGGGAVGGLQLGGGTAFRVALSAVIHATYMARLSLKGSAIRWCTLHGPRLHGYQRGGSQVPHMHAATNTH